MYEYICIYMYMHRTWEWTPPPFHLLEISNFYNTPHPFTGIMLDSVGFNGYIIIWQDISRVCIAVHVIELQYGSCFNFQDFDLIWLFLFSMLLHTCNTDFFLLIYLIWWNADYMLDIDNSLSIFRSSLNILIFCYKIL